MFVILYACSICTKTYTKFSVKILPKPSVFDFFLKNGYIFRNYRNAMGTYPQNTNLPQLYVEII